MAKRRAPVPLLPLSLVYIALGDRERALDSLRQALAQHKVGGRGTEISGLRSSVRGLAVRGSLAPRRRGAAEDPRCDPAPVAGTRIAYREGKQHLAAAGARRTARRSLKQKSRPMSRRFLRRCRFEIPAEA